MNAYAKLKQIHRHRKLNLWLPRGRGKWGGTNQNYEINI